MRCKSWLSVTGLSTSRLVRISFCVRMNRGSEPGIPSVVSCPENLGISVLMCNSSVTEARYLRGWKYVVIAAVMTTSKKDSSTMPNRTRITRQ